MAETKENKTAADKARMLDEDRRQDPYHRRIDKWGRCAGDECNYPRGSQNSVGKRSQGTWYPQRLSWAFKEEIIDLSARDVSDTIQRGGTILQTARCQSMRTEEGQQKAAAICKNTGLAD